MCYAVLSSSVTEFEVHLCIDLVDGWQEHVLMAHHLLVSAVVLLEDLDRHFSWREFSQNDVVLGKALHAWCQSRYLTYVSVHPIATWAALRCGCRVFLLLFCTVYVQLVMSVLFSLVTDLLLYEVRSSQGCKCSSDSVHRILTGSKPDAT